MIRQIARLVYMQGRGSNNRKLTIEEMIHAEKNFYKTLEQHTQSLSTIRNPMKWFKALAGTLDLPKAEKIASQDGDDFKWIEESAKADLLDNYLIDELIYTEGLLAKNIYLTHDLVREFSSRKPEERAQVVRKHGYSLLRFEYSLRSNELMRRKSNDDEYSSVLTLEELRELEGLEQITTLPLINTEFSSDNRYLAIVVEINHRAVLLVKDLEENCFCPIRRENIDESCVFDEQQRVYYVEKETETGKGRNVWCETLVAGTHEPLLEDSLVPPPATQRTLVFSETDYQYTVELTMTSSGEYILIRSFNELQDLELQASEFWYKATNSENAFLRVQQRAEGVFYTVKQQGNYFYIHVVTVAEPNAKVLKLEIPTFSSYASPAESVRLAECTSIQTEFLGALPFIEHSSLASIEHLETFSEFILQILTETANSLQYLQAQNLLTGDTSLVTYDDYEGQIKVANNKSYRINVIPEHQNYFSEVFTYKLSTLHSPDQLISYNLKNKQSSFIDFCQHIPEIDLAQFTSERINLPANDGEMLPVTLIYHKTHVKPSLNHLVLHTFGGDLQHNHAFSLDYTWLSMLERGLIWAIPHIRGTADSTQAWYSQGVGLHKTRHFQDYLDVTASLVSEKIAENVCAYGSGPSGGLTVAAVMCKEQDLYSAVVLRNPILNVKEYLAQHRRTTEFGDCHSSSIEELLAIYSPYSQDWHSGFSRLYIGVDYDHECVFQAIKFTAKLRGIQDPSDFLVYKEYPTWTSEAVKKAEEYAFLLAETIHFKPNK